jgi:hypothetical protein
LPTARRKQALGLGGALAVVDQAGGDLAARCSNVGVTELVDVVDGVHDDRLELVLTLGDLVDDELELVHDETCLTKCSPSSMSVPCCVSMNRVLVGAQFAASVVFPTFGTPSKRMRAFIGVRPSRRASAAS